MEKVLNIETPWTSAVPPVRTIVLDRPPVPVAPPVRERNPLREPAPATAGPERLRVRDLSIAYGGKPAVKSVSLSIHQGEVLALIGPSGCGKTTLLRTLNRLTELTAGAARAGSVLLDGEDIHELADTTLRTRVAMVFQQPNPFPMSIFDNVAFALREQSRSARAAASSSRWWSTRCAAPGCMRRSATSSTGPRCACPVVSSSGCASRARSHPARRCC